MVNYFIYAKDFSGSTGKNRGYHILGMKSLEKFKSDVDKIKEELLAAGEPPTESKIIYLHWGDKCYEVDEDTTRIAYTEMQCANMARYSDTIIDWIQKNYGISGENNKIKLLYIITDGRVYDSHAEHCFTMNENMFYETVVFHAFNEIISRIDLSVAASFFKSRCAVYRNYELFDSTDISSEFEYDKINAENFAVEKNSLKSYIKLKFIKNFKQDVLALQEINKLKKLRVRLLLELSSNSPNTEYNLDTKDRQVFLRELVRTDWYKHLTGTIVNEVKLDIEKSITKLINYIVSDKKSYAFDELKFSTKLLRPVREELIVDVNFIAEQEIELPDVILGDDKRIHVVILTEFNLLDKIIFHSTKASDQVSPATFSKFKSAMECPLCLVEDADISESIGYFYTLNVYKQLLENARIEPRTRRPFHGGLVLTDTDEFDKYNDYVLSVTYFNSKKINYNVGLFYYVLWKNCENKEWMDKNVVEHFKKYVMRRISETVCKIGLSALPLYPQEDTSLLTALWYCVEMSSYIFKYDSKNFMQERLRKYYDVAHYMIEILKHFDYDLDLDSIEKRKELIRYVMILKGISKPKEKYYYLLRKIFKTVHGLLVSEIENPFNLYLLNYLKLQHNRMLFDKVIDVKVHLNDYVHFMHLEGDLRDSKVGEGTFEICKNTYRPFFTLDKNKSFYTDLVRITKKVVINNVDDKEKIKVTYEAIDSLEFDKILSLYKLFTNCVKDCKKYPTMSEYINYISRTKKFTGDLVTIFPPNVYTQIEDVYARYQKVITGVDVNKFIEVCNTYFNRPERVKAEKRVNFNNDNEIKEFISNEELKVNLKKNEQKC